MSGCFSMPKFQTKKIHWRRQVDRPNFEPVKLVTRVSAKRKKTSTFIPYFGDRSRAIALEKRRAIAIALSSISSAIESGLY
ncbi:hypothetical protein CKA32_000960 [Geitlerinema sp. FC II]|nr:hypothetical protein CKA32_000960 [Geitlerinema sp. FC II]